MQCIIRDSQSAVREQYQDPFFLLNVNFNSVDLLLTIPLKRKTLKYSDGDEMTDI